jgi:PucR family transcriptional regulator, purine catabolism regulatory protein
LWVTLTVRDVLALDIVEKAGPEVLAGTHFLDREVKWVHSSDIPDIARFLRGGELLLTAGLGMGTSAKDQNAYVNSVAKAGAAALVVEVAGRMFAHLPDAAVRAGERVELPVIALAREVSFAEVSARVHTLLTEIQLRALTRERRIESTFSDALLGGADYLTMAQTLADLTNSAVILEDVTHGVRAVAGVADIEDAVGAWEIHAREIHHDDQGCVRRPVLMRGEPWGWLHVIPTAEPAGIGFAAERAAAAIAISMLTDRSVQARHEQRSTALISRLMQQDLNGSDFVAQVARLGVRMSARRLTVAMVNKTPDAAPVHVHHAADEVAADMGDYLVVIGTPPAERDVDPHRWVEGSHAGGGISRPATADTLHAAVSQAKSAAAVALSLGHRPFLRFDELGVERLLVALAPGPELASYVQDELGPLLAVDAKTQNPLLPTLREYLAAGGNKTEAAQRLFVQRRTLYHRLDRISAILGRSLEDPTTQQSLLLAVRALDLLDGKAGSPRGTANPPRTHESRGQA